MNQNQKEERKKCKRKLCDRAITPQKRYKNVKCSLGSVLLLSSNSDNRIKSLIETRCLAISQMAVKASHLCRVMIEKVLLEREENNVDSVFEDYDDNNNNDDEEMKKNCGENIIIDWPDFTKLNVFVQLFTKGCNLKKPNKPTKAIDWTWENYFEKIGYPTKQKRERHHSDYNLINYCAKTFQTAFINNLKLNLIPRQKSAIKVYLANLKEEENAAEEEEKDKTEAKKNCLKEEDEERKKKKKKKKRKVDKIDSSLVNALQKLINNNNNNNDNKWKPVGKKSFYSKDELKNKHAYFIKTHQKYLQTGKNLIDLIRYYNFLKREYGQYCTKLKNIPLVPKNEVKMHYVDFDAAGVKGLCHDIGKAKQLVDKGENAIDVMEKEGWNLIFNVDKLRKMGGKNWKFDRCIATDGVGCSIRYFKEEEEEDEEEFNTNNNNNNNKRIRSSSLSPEDNNNNNDESSPKKKKRIKKENNDCIISGVEGIGCGGEKRKMKKGNFSKPLKQQNTNNNDNSLNFQNDFSIDNSTSDCQSSQK